jgi:hypothetical protein
MDPYLEGDLWQEFHETLAGAIRAQVAPLLGPHYVALLAKRYVLDRPSLGVFDVPPRTIYPDVHVASLHDRVPGATIGAAGAATLTAPSVEVPSYVEAPQLSVEIRDVAQRRLVTVVEILSPANKYGEGLHEYLERRADLFRADLHLLELDLLRQGTRVPLAAPVPPATYYVLLSRRERRPYTQVWALALRDRLPTVPLPLLPPDPDVPLDLQAAADACFSLVGYERLIDYTIPPPPPELSTGEAAWLDGTLRAGGWRHDR